MSSLVIVGIQWGDEGKGKIVDWLARRADLVVRFQGGNNAGHTLVVDGEQTILHIVPSGVLHPGTVNLIGPGVVVDPQILCAELGALAERGLLRDPSRVRVSGRAHVVLDWHGAVDRAREAALCGDKIGTTGRGIGPTYEDKVARRGIRVADLLDAETLREALAGAATVKQREFEHYGLEPFELDAVVERARGFGRALEPYVDHVGRLLMEAQRAGKHILFEGAQGTFLDVDHGTYPFVTSSNCIAGAACTGAGVGPTAIDRVLGISKSYTTRVGGGPFPTEDRGAAGRSLRERGSEFGATTGRPRRCGWLDAVMLREAVTVNGLTDLALNKLDVLSDLPEIPVAIAYRIDGKRTDEMPMTCAELARAEPIFETLPGWRGDLRGARRVRELPDAARRYIEYVERCAGVPIALISVGPGRHETIAREDFF